MDIVFIKQPDLTICYSFSPVGVFGWGKDEKGAISSLNDNLYAFCNWMQKPLPKDTTPKVTARYNGKIEEVEVLEDKASGKKLLEVVMQSAFSFKCFLDSFLDGEQSDELIKTVYKNLPLQEGEGVIGLSAKLIESGDAKKLRAFAFLTFKSAFELYLKAKKDGVSFTDAFKFSLSFAC